MILIGLLLAGLALLVVGLALDGWDRAPVLIAPGAVLTIAALAQCLALFAAPPAGAATGPTLIAHRGAGGTGTENTIDAFASTPATTWETDVRWAGSGTPVLLHSADLGVFGCPTIRIVDVSATRARECGPLATLAQLVTLAEARPEVHLLVELKTAPTAAQWAVLDQRLAPVKSRTVVEAFGPVRLAKASARGYSTAYLTHTPTDVLPAGTDWYSPAWSTLDADQLAAMHARGVRVSVWTPGPDDWPSLPAGVDAIITDRPAG